MSIVSIMSTCRAGSLTVLVWIMVSLCTPVLAQGDLVQQRWMGFDSSHFTVLSQASDRQTQRFLRDLESWRQIAAYQIVGSAVLPAIPIPNYVYLFDSEADFAAFLVGEERGYFYATPRANFMGILLRDDQSLLQARHHYAHFLIRNFSDMRLPRWYEEGLAAYLAGVNIDDGRGELARPSADGYSALAQVSDAIPMGRLLYRDDSLASPRLIQFANLKSEALFHYLRHGYAEDAFPDRRAQLARYVELLLEGRAARFAFDQSFDITTAELDAEYVDYLSNSRRPRVDVEHGELAPVQVPGAAPLDPDRVAILLGELGLNSGRLDTAEQLFGSLVETEAPVARAYSGLGDALRFDLDEVSDQMIAAYFEQAIALAPEDLNIILDLGEYWESELSDCEKTYSEARRQSLFAVMQEQFTRAFKMAPDNPEVNLAMAQFYLFPEQDWRLGVSYQEKAFAALPADNFIMEQAAKYAMAANEFDYAEQLISEMAQPLHFYGEPDYVSDLRIRLLKKRRNEPYDACAVY